MTIILATATVTTVLALFLYKPIHKYKYVLFGVTAVLALIFHEEANLVSLGYVPFGIFMVVMLAGALDKGLIRKRLFMVRAELSIVAAILIAPHAFGYLEYYLDDVGLLNANLSFLMGVLSVLMLIPLFITSFRFIRQKMTYKQWSALHKSAYMFYVLVGLHLIMIQNERMWLYIGLFGTYFILKGTMLIPPYLKHKKVIQT